MNDRNGDEDLVGDVAGQLWIRLQQSQNNRNRNNNSAPLITANTYPIESKSGAGQERDVFNHIREAPGKR